MFGLPLRLLFLVLSAAPYIASEEGDVCTTLTPCSCMFPNGTGIDLATNKQIKSDTFNKTTESTQPTNLTVHTYYYFPCMDGTVQPVDPNNKNCLEPLALCRRRYKLDITKIVNTSTYNVNEIYEYEKFASNNKAQFTNNGRAIVYQNQPSHTTVELECTPTAEQDTLFVDDREPDSIVIRLYSKNACMKQIKEVSYRSTGSTLLIILFTLILFYLVLGVFTKKFLMGAQGIEIIPNLSFWRDLPALCRDGWLFARNGFRVTASSQVGPTSPDPNSYDSI